LVLWVVLFAVQVARGSSENTTSFGIHELHGYVQTSASAAEGPFGFPYAFAFQASEGGTLSVPGGGTITLSTTGTLNQNYLLDAGFASLASLQSAFPTGTYTFASSGNPNLSYTVGSALFPASIPQVTNGTWTNQVLVLDPTVANTLNFSTFAEYGSAGVASHMLFSISSLTGADSVNVNQQIVSVPVGNLTVASQPFTSYTIPAGTLSAGLSYFCELTFDTVASLDTTTISGDASILIYSNTVTFVIVAKASTATPAPAFSASPSNQTGSPGGSATFGVDVNFGAGGEPATTSWLWYFDGQPISFDGVKYVLGPGGSLTINGLAASDAGTYGVAVVTGGGEATSAPATLTIGSGGGSPPTITAQPVAQTIVAGGTVVFQVTATGATSYQWLLNGHPLANGNGYSGVTGSTLVVGGTTQAEAGNYSCAVANSVGTTTSSTAALAVSSTSDVGRLINISTRAEVGTGGNILIAGFVVGGAGTSGAESLLLRASGPALVPLGVTGALADPQLQLYQGSSLKATNDGWEGAATISAAASAVGAFAWSDSSSHDSALLVSESAGAYTAQVAGASNDTGVALVEVYDDTPAGTYTPSDPRLVNISARVQVGTGGNILIAGFVIGGATSKTVLVRASGPALVPFGVSGTLPDPQLQLFSGTKLIASNAGWGGNAEIAATAASVGAFPWSNPGSSDSALLLTLPPGAYTAQVSGVSGDTGVALVELYEVP